MKIHAGYVALIVTLATAIASAQVATGTPPFGTYAGGTFDTVNEGNLNVHFVIPVLHRAGRGTPFTYDLTYDSSVWMPGTSNGVTQWQPVNANWGWNAISQALTGSVFPVVTMDSWCWIIVDGERVHSNPYLTYLISGYTDPHNTLHPVTVVTTQGSTQCDVANTPSSSGSATDGSGWGMSVTNYTNVVVTGRGGISIVPADGTVTDANGNVLSTTVSGSTTTFTDTLGNSALSVDTVSSAQTTYSYTAPSGSTAKYSVNYTNYTVATEFGVSGINEYGPLANYLVSGITLPDGTSYSFTYEVTPGSCTPLANTYSSNCVTGRLASVALPTGGKITYTYSGGNNGIESDGSTAGLTRTLSPGGEWQYARAFGSSGVSTTTVYDPNENETALTFNGLFELTRLVQQFANGTYTPLLNAVKCYNGNYANCSTATVTTPITQTDVYSQPWGYSYRLSEVVYNTYGLVTDDKEYNYGVGLGAAPSSTYLVRETATTYGSYNASGCTALGNSIVNTPCQVIVYDWTSGSKVTLASSTYTYDQGTLQTTTGTPEHVGIVGSRGNLTTANIATSSTTSLSKTFTYYDTGNVYQANDVNGAQTTYNYANAASTCGNAFPSSISEPLNLSRSFTWNCTGGVGTQVTDENGNNVSSSYTDPDFWRPASVTDQMGNQSSLNYYVSPTATEATLNFNGTISTSNVRTTLDGFGRAIFNQRLQTQGGSNYDTGEIDYNNLGQPYISRMPYSATASPSSDNTSAPATTTTYDALGRVLSAQDADGGYVSLTYTKNDVLQTVSGTPSGTQSFEKQFEYDGLGRLTSVCEINVSGNLPNAGTCGQYTSQNGYWTKYTYDALGHLLTVTQNAQASSGTQTRSFTYDLLGRMTAETNPETGHNGASGTVHYTYDSTSSSTCGSSPALGCGDLVQKLDAASNTTNYTYDALHRVLTAGNSGISGATLRKFVYDSESSYPSGVSVAYGKTHMVEAQTTTTSGSLLTDEFFSYDKDGDLTDVYESTPHSGGYYHSNASYWPNGVLNTLSLLNSSGTALIPKQTYGVDGEGRPNSVTAASGQNPVSSVTYSSSSTTNYLGALTGVTFGSGDSDAFTYDPNTGRMGANSTTPAYTFTVNGKTDAGTLTWNPNGTLQQFVINDQIPKTTDNQTCSYTYDDLARVSGTSCNSSPAWSQTFTYDAFGNIQKAGTLTFNPSYVFTNANNAITNQFYSFTSNPQPSYDANGNLLVDNLNNNYTWDPNWGNMLQVATVAGTVNATYDALGQMVEQQNGSAYTEILYSPIGKTALMNGSSLNKAFVPLPGGETAIYNASGLAYYRHTDWLGSSRLTSTVARGLYSSQAYAPFGEAYQTSGANGATSSAVDPNFTGQNSDTVPSLYDFLFREHSMSQGRWIAPDPAGVGAVDPTNPQSWNRYAYVTNSPLANVDPSGLCPGCPSGNRQVAPDVYLSGTGWDEFDMMNIPVITGDSMYIPSTYWTVTTTIYDSEGNQIGDPFETFGVQPGGWQNLGSGVDVLSAISAANNYIPFSLYPPSMFTRGPNMPVVSQWRPPKPTDIVTGPPAPYKPSVVDCMTGPNDAVDRMVENAPPVEHDPSAGGVVWQPGNRGNYPATSPETTEGANALTVLFAGFLNWVGCMANAF